MSLSVFKIRFLFWVCLIVGAPHLVLAQNNSGNKQLQKIAYRQISLNPDEVISGRFIDESSDSTISDIIIEAVRNGLLIAYTDALFTDSLDAAGVNICLDRWHDTSLVAENADSAELVMRITVSRYTDGRTNTLKIAENWLFDEAKGTTTVQITGIAPQRNRFAANNNTDKYTDMFWVKYTDIQQLIARYESYHPGNNIPIQIWRDYFEREAKPKSR